MEGERHIEGVFHIKFPCGEATIKTNDIAEILKLIGLLSSVKEIKDLSVLINIPVEQVCKA